MGNESSDTRGSDVAENPEFSVVVPVYNSERTLPALVERLRAVFEGLGRTYEIVLVDDGSRDKAWQVIERMHAEGEPIRAYRFMRNHGQHFALKCGLDHCAGEYAITIDDDLQHPPEEIPKLIEAIESDPDVDVIMGRFEEKKHSVFRNAGTWLISRIQRVVFKKSTDIKLSSFRILNRPVLDEISRFHHARPRIGFIILSITSGIKNITVRHESRSVGRSGYTLRKLISNTLDNVINYSALPLRLVSLLGILSSVTSVTLGIYFLVQYLLGNLRVSGFTTTILVILFTSGAILFCFGLLGEYLSRMFTQMLMHREYAVRTTLLPGQSQDPKV